MPTTRPVRRVLLAMDGSPVSRRAATLARALFGDAGSEYLAINVVRHATPLVTADMSYGMVYPLESDEELVKDSKGQTEQHVEEAGLEASEVLAEIGDPVECVVRAADEHDVDVIVVGSHQKGFLARLLEGSVSEGVARHAHRPVLVVPDGASLGEV